MRACGAAAAVGLALGERAGTGSRLVHALDLFLVEMP